LEIEELKKNPAAQFEVKHWKENVNLKEDLQERHYCVLCYYYRQDKQFY
jgi:hypothetical protein